MKLPPSCNANAAEVGEAYMLFDCIRQIPIPIPTSWAMGGVWLISRAEVFETSVLRCGMSLVMSSVSKYPPAEPEALGFEPLKAAGAFVTHANFLLGLARTNDCAQHSHLSAANRAIFIASIICVTVQHSKTENRGILPEMSNCYCHPGKAGGSPFRNRSAACNRSENIL
jgi:hypothetical protein